MARKGVMSAAPGPAEYARLGLVVADDLEHRGYRAAGVVRRLAELVETCVNRHGQADAGACPRCGAPVEQLGRGRPRIYCSDLCRNRAAKRTRNAKVAS